MLQLSPQQIWLFAGVLSLLAHGMGFGAIAARELWPKNKASEPVKIRIAEKPPEPKPEPIPPKPIEKPKPKPKPPEPKVATERQQPKEPPKEAVKPIQGLDKNSLDPSGKGVAAPIGNTLMTEDTGERVNDAAALGTDLTSDAQLIRDSITIPQYTDAALDANFEGYVIVDVFVSAKGDVEQAELRKKVGYGMDERILSVAQVAKFVPRKNKIGTAISGWTEIKFNMQIP